MDAGVFDVAVMVIGLLLIAAGVLLFVSGKLAGQNNKVEAFGIKMDVNNPSLLLIAAGIGLVLVPRLLPDPIPRKPSGTDKISEQVHDNASDTGRPKTDAETNLPHNEPSPIQTGSDEPSASRHSASGPFRYTRYELLSQIGDGENTGARGQLAVVLRSPDLYDIHLRYNEPSAQGMMIPEDISGKLLRRGGAWFVQVVDPDASFGQVVEIPVTISARDDRLELHYSEDGMAYREEWRGVASTSPGGL